MPHDGDHVRLRVATFNIKHGAPADSYRGDTDLLVQSCLELDADILALQEVDVGLARSAHADQARAVAEATGMDVHFAKARRHAYRGQYGNALLVRGTLSDVEVVPLTGDHRHVLRLGTTTFTPFREPRNVIVANVEVKGVSLAVATGHLATDATARHSQLDQAAAALLVRPNPRLLCGDLNIQWAQAAEWLQPYGLELAEALADPIDPTLRSGVDHVAVAALRVRSVRSRRLAISDHEARIVEFDLPTTSRGADDRH